MSRSQSNFKQQHEFGASPFPFVPLLWFWCVLDTWWIRGLVFLSAEQRKTESQWIKDKYPGRFPVSISSLELFLVPLFRCILGNLCVLNAKERWLVGFLGFFVSMFSFFNLNESYLVDKLMWQCCESSCHGQCSIFSLDRSRVIAITRCHLSSPEQITCFSLVILPVILSVVCFSFIEVHRIPNFIILVLSIFNLFFIKIQNPTTRLIFCTS